MASRASSIVRDSGLQSDATPAEWHPEDRDTCIVCWNPDAPAQRTCPNPCTHACCEECFQEVRLSGISRCPFCQKGWCVATRAVQRSSSESPMYEEGFEELHVGRLYLVVVFVLLAQLIVVFLLARLVAAVIGGPKLPAETDRREGRGREHAAFMREGPSLGGEGRRQLRR
ncbi:hypothetical protein CERZMDRAFT_83252 [Cercospora zeae-maydis SCOH1-5]|uniref:RING-type domain-containing protein n=1 Tax=Cercospora zeae-maydis SCOH1-5 TaxID=717836 RepID=A0A6A6FKR3_9PEZI|nr:hypothetical protein CERZMDRAFT_83252 [Cercospora zeae-maydis SCOH1-5]